MIIPLGGGGSKVVASIIVSYPAGSTCTCTLGSKVLTAKDTSGKWVFGLPSTGTWTVKAASGDKTASKTVSITAEGQVETVGLAYELVLFDGANGGDNTTLTGGWKSVIAQGTGYGTAQIADGVITVYGSTAYGGASTAYMAALYTKNKIDITDYNMFRIHVNEIGNKDDHSAILVKSTQKLLEDGWWDAPLTASTCVAYKKIDSSEVGTDIIADISAVTGSYYLGLAADGSSKIVTPKVWLE